MFASCPAVCDLSLLKTFLVFEKMIVQQMTEKRWFSISSRNDGKQNVC